MTTSRPISSRTLVRPLLQVILILSSTEFFHNHCFLSHAFQHPLLSPLANKKPNLKQDPSWCPTNLALPSLLTAACLFTAVLPAFASDVPPQPSITQCAKSSTSNSMNCVSTASIKQLDLYMPPWTFPDNMSAAEVMARLKGAATNDIHISIVNEQDNYLKLSAIRKFSTDTIEFVINPEEHFITFKSQQTEGPDINDFGAQRSRLDEIRKTARVFTPMGGGLNSADTAPREGVVGQLKAFYGIRSGTGFEDTLLDLD